METYILANKSVRGKVKCNIGSRYRKTRIFAGPSFFWNTASFGGEQKPFY